MKDLAVPKSVQSHPHFFIHFSIIFPTKLQANVWGIKRTVARVLAQPHPSDLVDKVFNLIP